MSRPFYKLSRASNHIIIHFCFYKSEDIYIIHFPETAGEGVPCFSAIDVRKGALVAPVYEGRIGREFMGHKRR